MLMASVTRSALSPHNSAGLEVKAESHRGPEIHSPGSPLG